MNFVVLSMLTTIAYLPAWVHSALSNLLAFFYPFFATKEYERLLSNLNLIRGLSPHSQFAKLFATQCIRHQITAGFDAVVGIFRPHALSLENEEDYARFLRTHRESGKGLVVITAHLGNWEVLAQHTSRLCGSQLFVLAKPHRWHVVNRLLEVLRGRAGGRLLWNDSKQLMRQMLQVLNDSDALGFVMDQKPQGRVGTQLSFLGRKAEFVNGPATLAIRKQCPVVATACVRTAARRYRFLYKEIPASDTESSLTATMVATLEEFILIYPEQWTWNYKRWR
jgi:lauroyl/myristoyl acyltransferase